MSCGPGPTKDPIGWAVDRVKMNARVHRGETPRANITIGAVVQDVGQLAAAVERDQVTGGGMAVSAALVNLGGIVVNWLANLRAASLEAEE